MNQRFKPIFSLLLLLLSTLNLRAQQDARYNQRDAAGKAHGLWYVHQEALRGEPELTSFGAYDHGLRTGIWYVSNAQGNIVSIESFKQGVRDGKVQYFENGKLICIGHYRGVYAQNEKDTVHLIDPISLDEYWVSVNTERGSVKHGNWRFYDELSGNLTKEEFYQMDELIFKKDFIVSQADSIRYERRNRLLPHSGNGLQPASKFKSKEPTKSLIGG